MDPVSPLVPSDSGYSVLDAYKTLCGVDPNSYEFDEQTIQDYNNALTYTAYVHLRRDM